MNAIPNLEIICNRVANCYKKFMAIKFTEFICKEVMHVVTLTKNQTLILRR